ncbi:MAG TPA: ABC transporter permease, partial [Anaerolineales bacterium]|nr:ABC transporter permease [Anaerolineales bacterium]
MIRILDIALKDLMQLSRDFKTFMFLLIMPIIFTFLFGFAFGGFGGNSDSRLPVGYLSEDDHWVTQELHEQLTASEVVRLDENLFRSSAELEKQVAEGDLAAAIIVPDGYGRAFLKDKDARLIVIADTGTQSWTTIEAELLTLTGKLDSAVHTATIIDEIDPVRLPFDYAFEKSLAAWDEPPIAITETTSLAVEKANNQSSALAHTAPG